jgi:hypothetical protein
VPDPLDYGFGLTGRDSIWATSGARPEQIIGNLAGPYAHVSA